MSKIKIKFRKFLNEDDGFERYYKVISIEACGRVYLPYVYKMGYPYCVGDYSDIEIHEGPGFNHEIKVGHDYKKKEFEKMLKLLKECAKRLHKINLELKDRAIRNKSKYAEWTSDEEVIEI
jgi:hypothetical protein